MSFVFKLYGCAYDINGRTSGALPSAVARLNLAIPTPPLQVCQGHSTLWKLWKLLELWVLALQIEKQLFRYMCLLRMRLTPSLTVFIHKCLINGTSDCMQMSNISELLGLFPQNRHLRPCPCTPSCRSCTVDPREWTHGHHLNLCVARYTRTCQTFRPHFSKLTSRQLFHYEMI